jgi:protein-L-isoaspartate(D-aspartate) O-methyltransferase
VKYGQLTGFLIDQGVLQDEVLIQAFEKIDRQDFLPMSHKHQYLENRPLPIGYDQTNSQPFTVAFMLELLLPRKGEKILDVGSGSGWTSALIGATGAIVDAVELIPELVEQAQANISKYELSNVTFNLAEKQLGWQKNAPYDKIIVSAGAKQLPQVLTDQLKPGGRMIIPVGEAIWLVEKSDGTKPDNKLKITKFEGFIFVPLVY